MGREILITPRTFRLANAEQAGRLEELGYKLIFNPYGRLLTEEEMINLIGGVEGIIVGLDPLGIKVLESAPNLKVISKYGVGVDNIDLAEASRRKIIVTNTPGTNSLAVAELTMGLILNVARHICCSDRKIREGQWGKYQGFELKGKSLGLIGSGQIGKEVALLAKGFGMKIICYDLKPDQEWARKVGATYLKFEQLLAVADVISLHLPLGDDTYHLLSREELNIMKPTAILINTARGGIIDEEVLYLVLKEGRLAGAALDVYEQEPPDDSPLRSLDNVVMTSHMGAHTREAIGAMGRLAVENLIAGLAGRRPEFTVNVETSGLDYKVGGRGDRNA